MKRLVFVSLIIVLGLVNPSVSIRNSLLETFAPYIEFNKSLYYEISDLSSGILEINKLREENFNLKNLEFVFVSKDFKERLSQTSISELDKLKKVVEDDSYFKDRKIEYANILYLDKFNSTLFIRKAGNFEKGDSVLIGRFYIGMIVAVNSTSYEVELWNKKEKNIGAFVVSPGRENLVVNIISDNYNTSYIENILSTEIVEIGDLIVTSSVNKWVPSNLYLGIVDRVEGVSTQTFRKALIKKPYSLEKSNYVILMKYD